MEHRAVGRVAAGPAVTLHATLEALALRVRHHVHQLAGAEQVHGEGLTDLVRAHRLRLLEPDLAQYAHRRGNPGLLVHAGHRLGDILLPRFEAELEGVVAMRRPGAEAHHRARPRLDHGHRDEVAVLPEDLGHALLPADQPFLHRHDGVSPVFAGARA